MLPHIRPSPQRVAPTPPGPPVSKSASELVHMDTPGTDESRHSIHEAAEKSVGPIMKSMTTGDKEWILKKESTSFAVDMDNTNGKHGKGASTNRSTRMSLSHYIEDRSKYEMQKRTSTIDNRIVLDPDVFWMKAWSIWIRLLLIFSLFYASFRIGIDHSHVVFHQFGNPIGSIFFLIDIVVFFRKGFYDEERTKVMDLDIIYKRYWGKLFLFDLLALTPVELLSLGYLPVRLIELPKMLRLYRLKHEMSEMRRDPSISPTFATLCDLILIMFFSIHLVACLYWGVAHIEGFGYTSFLPSAEAELNSTLNQYSEAIFWSIGALASFGLPRDSVPETDLECILSLVALHFGVLLLGYEIEIMSQFASIGYNMSRKYLRLSGDLRVALKALHTPDNIQKHVQNFVTYSRLMKSSGEAKWLNEVPATLRRTIDTTTALSRMVKVPVFQSIDYRAASAISERLRSEIIVPGQEVCWLGVPATQLFLVQEGEFIIFNHRGKTHRVGKDDYFGDYDMLVSGTYSFTARATKYSIVYVLNLSDMNIALMFYPNERRWLREQCRRCRALALSLSKIGTSDIKERLCVSENARAALHTPRTRLENWTSADATDFNDSPHYPICERRLSQRLSHLKEKENILRSQKKSPFDFFHQLQWLNYVVEPDSPFSAVWKLLTTFFLLLQFTFVPMHVVFAFDKPSSEILPILVISYLADCVMVVDIFISLNTATIQEGVVEHKLSAIRRRYLKSCFVRHLVASFPFELICIHFSWAIWLRMLRLLRLYDLLVRLNEYSNIELPLRRRISTLLRLIALLLSYMCIVYLVSILYTTIGTIVFGHHEFITLNHDCDETPFHRLLFSLFVSLNILNRLGSHIVPHDAVEYAFVIGVIFIGILSSVFLIGRLEFIASGSQDHAESMAHTKKRMLNFIQQRRLPDSLSSRIRDYVALNGRRKHGSEFEDSIRQLPKSLRSIIKNGLCYKMLKKQMFLHDVSPNLIIRLCASCRIDFFPEGEIIFRRRHSGDRFALVLGGIVRHYIESSASLTDQPHSESQKGGIFGIKCLVSETYELTSVVQKNACIAFIDFTILRRELSKVPHQYSKAMSIVYESFKQLEKMVQLINVGDSKAVTHLRKKRRNSVKSALERKLSGVQSDTSMDSVDAGELFGHARERQHERRSHRSRKHRSNRRSKSLSAKCQSSGLYSLPKQHRDAPNPIQPSHFARRPDYSDFNPTRGLPCYGRVVSTPIQSSNFAHPREYGDFIHNHPLKIVEEPVSPAENGIGRPAICENDTKNVSRSPQNRRRVSHS